MWSAAVGGERRSEKAVRYLELTSRASSYALCTNVPPTFEDLSRTVTV